MKRAMSKSSYKEMIIIGDNKYKMTLNICT